MDHALFYYPRATWIWRLASLLHRITSLEFPAQLFLDSLRLSLGSEIARIYGIHIAYVAYYIWLIQNS